MNRSVGYLDGPLLRTGGHKKEWGSSYAAIADNVPVALES